MSVNNVAPQRAEALGAAESVVQSFISHVDHCWHNRPGVVVPDPSSKVGVRWDFATYRRKCADHPDVAVRPEKADGKLTGRLLCSTCQADVRTADLKVVYRKTKAGKKNVETKVGVLQADGSVVEGGRAVGRWQPAGLFQEAARWLYGQVAAVWELDNELAARWASFAFSEENKDKAVIMAAFMLVQSRKGDPVLEDGKMAFRDEDYREVGEAMILASAGKKGKGEISPRMLLRIREVLSDQEIAAVNRRLGFGRSARKAFLGRWPSAVEKWLSFREENPRVLEGLVKSGQRQTVIELCGHVGYRPQSESFFRTLQVRQKQAPDGRRTVAIGADIGPGQGWAGMTEEQVCEAIVRERPSFKRAFGMVPREVGVTRAVVMACIESGGVSDKELLILAPTLEELGLSSVQEVKDRLARAAASADDRRAANVAARVKSQGLKDVLNEAADNAVKAAVAEVVKGVTVYFLVDKSSSMEDAIARAKEYLKQIVPAFPEESVHTATFNTTGQEIQVKHRSAAGVENAFRGVSANGGTDYRSGIDALVRLGRRPAPGNDVVFVFVGDEGHFAQYGNRGNFDSPDFADFVRACGLNPVAFGLIPVTTEKFGRGNAVRKTANILGIPCFEIDESTFSDVHAVPRTLRALISSTPVSRHSSASSVARRESLIEKIMGTDLLRRPAWAA